MMWSNKKLIACVIIILSFCMPMIGFAQGGPGDPGCDPLDPACPIDGGLSLLIAAGIGLGAKKAYNSRKEKLEAQSLKNS